MEIKSKYCGHCKIEFKNEYMFCPMCGKSLENNDIDVSELNEGFRSVYGKWNVTTYGNYEGSTITNLGDYEGYIDDIALSLADKAVITLKFKPAKEEKKLEKLKNIKRVRVCFPFEVYEGKKSKKEFDAIVKKLFTYRDDVEVDAINSYSFAIKNKN